MQVRSVQVRAVQDRPGQFRVGKVRPGQVRLDQVRSVQVHPGQVRTLTILAATFDPKMVISEDLFKVNAHTLIQHSSALFADDPSKLSLCDFHGSVLLLRALAHFLT